MSCLMILPSLIACHSLIHLEPSVEESPVTESPTRLISWKDQVTGQYEDRLRRHSSPEKIFEYFASVQIGSESYMTQADLARAITPYGMGLNLAQQSLGSRNFKFNFKTLLHQPSKVSLKA